MKLNKKSQSAVIGSIAAQVMFLGLTVFGILQLFAFLAPKFGIEVDKIVMHYFGGGTVVFIFIAAGLIGVGLNEVLERLSAGIEQPFDSRVAAFITMGILVVVFAYFFGTMADAGVISSKTAAAMLLP